MNHNHLTVDERNDIYLLKAQDLSLSSIGTASGRSKRTISRELVRNSGLRGYRSHQAQQKALARRRLRRAEKAGPRELWTACRRLIEHGYSPQQASGRAKKLGFGEVSHEYLYRRIYAGKKAGDLLWRHLRCQKQRRKRYGSGRNRRGRIPNRMEIEYRCARAEKRAIVGHWEGDTIIGRNQKSVIVTLVGRKSGFTLAARVSSKNAGKVSAAIISLLECHKKVPWIQLSRRS